mmetsp:Transcript_17747/g.41149  ORF Transcript_17747/g.41149 Transcript_17747/m.41149 type:complete len:215 (+) Transcript_17747:52-696(+)
MASLIIVVTLCLTKFWLAAATSCESNVNAQACLQAGASSLLQTRTRNAKAPSRTRREVGNSTCADTDAWLLSMLQTGAQRNRSAQPVDSEILSLQEHLAIVCSCSDVANIEVRNLRSRVCEPDGRLGPLSPVPANCSSDGSWFLNGTCCEGFRKRWDWWSFGYTCDTVTCAELGERPDAHNMILPCCDDLVEERVKWANDTEMLLCVVPSVTTT